MVAAIARRPCGAGAGALSRLEDGRREAGLRVLERIAIALEVEVEDLVRRG